jgi:hypothetical protein
LTKTRYYDIHGIAAIELNSSKESLVDEFDKELGFFRTDQSKPYLSLQVGVLPESVDFRGASPLGGAILYAATEEKTIILQQAKPTSSKKDVQYVIFGDLREDSEVTIHIPNKIKIEGQSYSPAKWLMHKLIGKDLATLSSKEANEILVTLVEPSLYYFLPNRGYSLLHAAAVYREKGVLFFGPSNIGKSTITLEMVSRGWEFLGDDLILVDGKKHILAYPKTIKLEGQTLASHSQLFDSLSPNMGLVDKFLLRWIKSSAKRHPFKSPFNASISQLFSEAKIRKECDIDYIVRLNRAAQEKPTIQEIDLDTCIRSLAAGLFWEFNGQRWRHNEYRYCRSYALNNDFILEEAVHHEKINEILSKNFSNSSAFELRMPYDYSKIDDAANTLLAKL